MLVSIAALVATWPTRVAAAIWLTAGVMAIGHRSLESLPSLGLGPAWREGPRSIFVLTYYLACWPKYADGPVARRLVRIGGGLRRFTGMRRQKGK
jgi:hypothetical protein